MTWSRAGQKFKFLIDLLENWLVSNSRHVTPSLPIGKCISVVRSNIQTIKMKPDYLTVFPCLRYQSNKQSLEKRFNIAALIRANQSGPKYQSSYGKSHGSL